MRAFEYGVIAFNTALLLANLAVLSLNLKLYTEILKDSAQNRRSS